MYPKKGEYGVKVFQAVNPLLLVTAPEIAVGKQPLIAVPFHPLGDDEILPQTAHVTPQVRRILGRFG